MAFQIAPRINAGGRMESAVQCVELLTGQDERRVEELAERLGEDNARRQAQEQEMIAAAESELADADFTSFRAIIVCGEGWNPGVVGLAASRLTEKYHYPSIVLTRQEDDLCVGSCRSIKGVDIFAALSSCKDLFTRFGGHPQAAGLTIRYDDIAELRRRLNEYLMYNVDPKAYLPVIEYDCELDPAQLDIETARELELLAPTGFGNPAPVFRMQAQVRSATAVGQGGAHLKAVLAAGIRVMRLNDAPCGQALRPSDDAMRMAYRYVAQNALYLAGLSDMGALSAALAAGAGISRAQAVAVLHMFRELELIELPDGQSPLRVPPMHKVRLSDSRIYRRLGGQ